MVVYVSHHAGDDYYKDVYKALKQSETVKNHEIELILPHETEEYVNSLPLIEKSDVILVIAHNLKHSVGCGIEIGYALAHHKRVVLLQRKSNIIPRSVISTITEVVSYNNIEDLTTYLNNL